MFQRIPATGLIRHWDVLANGGRAVSLTTGIYLYVVLPLAALVMGVVAAIATVAMAVIGGAFALFVYGPAMLVTFRGGKTP